MTERAPETIPPQDAPEVVVEREEGEEDQKKRKADMERAHVERRAHIEQLLKEDTAESRERIAQILNEWEPADEIPDEFKGLAEDPNKRKPIWAARTFTALKTEDKAVSFPKWIGYKSSALLVGIDNWGKNMIKKNAPWVGKFPIVGTWLLSEPKKTWEELDKEAAKKREPIDKANKAALEKAAKDLEAKAKKDEADLKRAETTENTKMKREADSLNRKLLSFATPLEEYAYKNASEEEKATILKAIETDLPAREEKRKMREFESMLIQHMTPAEQEVFKAVIPSWPTDDDVEKAEKIKQIEDMLKAKDALQQKVANELPTRTHIAEANKGGKGKGKKGGGGGGGGGKGKGKR